MRSISAWMLIFGLAGCASSRPVVTAPVPAPSVVTRQIELGKSVRGSPIRARVFGSGTTTVFVLAGIHGDEPESVDLADRLVALLEADSSLVTDRRIVVLPVANPDGGASGTRTNVNGVDLNRNFPASNYRGSRRYGTSAASQPETQAILSALEQFPPALIISIHSITRGRQCNNYDGPAKAIAELMSRSNHYPATPSIGYPTPGSLGTYAGVDRQIPMITLELPKGGSPQTIWAANRSALLAAIWAAE